MPARRERTILILDEKFFSSDQYTAPLVGYWDDNGGSPEGDLLPLQPVDHRDYGVAEAIEAGYAREVDAVYFYSALEVVRYAHDVEVDLDDFSESEVDDLAWGIVQNLGQYSAWYSGADIFVFANNLPLS